MVKEDLPDLVLVEMVEEDLPDLVLVEMVEEDLPDLVIVEMVEKVGEPGGGGAVRPTLFLRQRVQDRHLHKNF